jgi:hypothetical protein
MRMDLTVQQRHRQLADERGVTRISSSLLARWRIRRGDSPARWRWLRLASSMEAIAARRPAAVRRQHDEGE